MMVKLGSAFLVGLSAVCTVNGYCTPNSPSSPEYEIIKRIQMEGLDVERACPDVTGVDYQNEEVVKLSRSESNPSESNPSVLRITLGTCNSNFLAGQLTVYIDRDGDGEFQTSDLV